MNSVIENVLEMSRRRQPTPVKLNLRDFLLEFRDGFLEVEQGTQVDVSVDPADTEVRMDKSQFTQALTNLAGNGIRYGREAGNPRLRLEGGIDSHTDRPFLNVIDHGRGVAADQLPNLFEPFFTTAKTGTGLGLYISRELCEANQARLTYSPQEDGGSCFRITFAHPDRITA